MSIFAERLILSVRKGSIREVKAGTGDARESDTRRRRLKSSRPYTFGISRPVITEIRLPVVERVERTIAVGRDWHFIVARSYCDAQHKRDCGSSSQIRIRRLLQHLRRLGIVVLPATHLTKELRENQMTASLIDSPQDSSRASRSRTDGPRVVAICKLASLVSFETTKTRWSRVSKPAIC
jgi:hypothetical protein